MYTPSHLQHRKTTPTSSRAADEEALDDEDDEAMLSPPQQTSPSPSVQLFPSPWGTRHTLAVLGFLGFASSYSMRVNLSIAIVSMVNSTMKHQHHHSHNSTAIPCPELLNLSSNSVTSSSDLHELELQEGALHHPKFNWTPAEQGIILGSFFYGQFSLKETLIKIKWKG